MFVSLACRFFLEARFFFQRGVRNTLVRVGEGTKGPSLLATNMQGKNSSGENGEEPTCLVTSDLSGDYQ